jgi:hypothetical protein
MVLFAVARRISRANIKKMNLEIDDSKKTQETLLTAATKQIHTLLALNADYYRLASDSTIRIRDEDAADTKLPSACYDAVFLHPPYLTNTAFSEFTQLQLAIEDIDHKAVWKRELRCRGSFLHEPNGLRKYLVGWSRIMQEATRIVKRNGHVFTVVGDGQIDYVRIPVGAITEEFATDLGLELVESVSHVLKNHTGQTQSRKMKCQHISVFRKRT